MNHQSLTFGDLLRQYLHRKRGLSQNKLANGIDVDSSTISKICTGKRKPDRTLILKIVDWLYERGALSSVEEANQLLKAEEYSELNPEQSAEATLLNKLMQVEHPPEPPEFPLSHESAAPSRKRAVHWGTSPDVTGFYGRTFELNALKQWVVDERCRVVGITGGGGIGKTRLAKKLAQELFEQFEYIFWGSLRDAPPLEEVLRDCILFLSDSQESDLPERYDQLERRLLQYLQQRRCLIIFDNAEAILSPGERAGKYTSEHQNYGHLIRMIGETNHQSCLLMTSREKPKDLSLLEHALTPQQRIRSYPLHGMFPDEFSELVRRMRVTTTDPELAELTKRCSGNPKILEILIPIIRKYHQGNLSAFLTEETTVYGEVKDIMQQQFGRLSLYEQEVMYWLAIEREPVSLSDLRQRILNLEHRSMLIETLNSLEDRSLLERVGGDFSLQPAVMEHIISALVSQMFQEIMNGQIELFHRHALMVAQAKDYIRESQKRLILVPLANRLMHALERLGLEVQFRSILTSMRQYPSHKRTYAVGNMINLLLHVQSDLSGWDFSGLAVWQAYLRNTDLRRATFAHTDLTGTVFTEVFNSVMSVACSPDGSRLATLGRDGEIFIWHLVNGKILAKYTERTPSRWIRSVTFSPNGRWLACARGDLNIRLLDAISGNWVTTFTGHSNVVRATAFHPNGHLLASGSDDQTIRVWDVQTGDCIEVLHGHSAEVRSVAFHPEGHLFASSSADTTIWLWDTATYSCVRVLSGHTDQVSAVVFHPELDMLISSSYDQTIRLWDIQTGVCLSTLKEHKDWVTSLALNSKQHLLASGSADSTILIWDISQSQPAYLRRLTDHTNTIWSVSFSSDTHTLVSCSDDQTLRLWDTQHWHCSRHLAGYINPVLSIAFSPDGVLLAGGYGDQAMQVWVINTGQCYRTFRKHVGRVTWVKFADNGSMIISIGEDRNMYFWMYETEEIHHTIFLDTVLWTTVFAIAPFKETTSVFLSHSVDDKCIRQWDIPTGQLLRNIKLHDLPIETIAFSPDGVWFASGSDDKTIKIWDAQVETCYHILRGHIHWVWCVAFSPDNQLLASGSEDLTVRLWDFQSDTCLKIFEGHEKTIWSVAFSCDNRLLASGSDDKTVRVWDIRTGKCIQKLEHPDQVKCVAFSPTEGILASGCYDGIIRLWDANTGEMIRTLYVERPYERLNITGAAGLTDVQRETLRELGAVEE